MTKSIWMSFVLLVGPVMLPAAAGQTLRADQPPAAEALSRFGGAITVSGGQIIISNPISDRAPGVVDIYERQVGEWGQTAQLTSQDEAVGDQFGVSVDASGDRLIVGAAGADSGAGAAYVFERGASGWKQVARLTAPGVAAGDSLGGAVAVDGDLALVSAIGADSGAGRVYAFRRAGQSWEPAGRLSVEGTKPADRYGRALDVAGGMAFVSGARSDSTGGAVFVFSGTGKAWGQPVKVAAADADRVSRFGAAILAGKNLLLVGAPGMNRFRGAVYAYRPGQGGWSPAGSMAPPDSAERTLFGAAISVSSDGDVWIGAPGTNDFRGAVYRYAKSGEGWGLGTTFALDSLDGGDGFGGALAAGDGVAAVGLPGDDFGEGTAVILAKENGQWKIAKRVMGQVRGLDPLVGSERSCDNDKIGKFDCSNVDLLAFIPVQQLGGGRGVEVNDVWGWTDPETHKEYALVGRMDGTAFVDITDPMNPIFVGSLPMTAGASSSVWRDIKVYKDHAYVVSDNAGEHGVQIFDLTHLRNVANPPQTFTEDARYDRIHSAHNIVIDTDSGFAYTVGNSGGGETCGGGLHMIDIRDPENPKFAGCFSDPRTGRQKTGYTHDAECVMYHGPDTDYTGHEICFGSNETALSIADVTDKANPKPIAVAEYPNVGYTHQAWLTDDQKYLFLDDELDEMQGLVDHTRTLIWDISDLDDPVLAKEFLNPNTEAIDHNLYIVGDKVYQSNYVTGLRVLDIKDVTNPVEVGHFDTDPFGDNGARFDGTWSNYPFFKSGTIVVTSMKEGLFLLKYRGGADKPIS